ncbi:DMT family transporter [Intrasporangium sp.]|uniref:DMT family transporter n=1 Tax=Intrasporangium sp. TaxID=1925024 RepID=UPI002939A676|nr:DMT family transporter [Intrasporangium sp.]MDV3223027.1 DMT family transporter [Intrasporangium sp.]
MSRTSLPTVRSARIGLLQISLAGALWGTGGLAVQLIRDIMPMSVLTISAYRMLIAAIVLVVVVLVVGRGGPLRALVKERPVHAVAVGCGTAAYQAFYFGAVVTAGVTVATAIALGLAPVLLSISDAARERRLIPLPKVMVLIAALAGLVLVSGFADIAGTAAPQSGLGILLAMASGTTYAVTTVLGRTLAQRADPLVLTTATTTTGALVLLSIGVLAGPTGPILTTDPAALGWLIYLGVFTMAMAYGLLYAGLRTTPGSTAVIASLLEPVTAAVSAALFLSERLPPTGIAGTILILTAVAGISARPRAPRGQP